MLLLASPDCPWRVRLGFSPTNSFTVLSVVAGWPLRISRARSEVMATPGPPVDKDAAPTSPTPIESSSSAFNALPKTTVTPPDTTVPTAPVPAAPTPSSTDPVKLEDSPAPSRLNSTDADAETPGTENDTGMVSSTAGRKRKQSSLSARGVANLTPEQLAKKRANDRQAQRAIRERTKVHIDALEQQVRDLSSQKPILDLQTALRQNDSVQAENRELRQKLQAVMDVVRPALGKPESTLRELPCFLFSSIWCNIYCHGLTNMMWNSYP